MKNKLISYKKSTMATEQKAMDIIYLLDKSGSMTSMGDEPRQAYNTFVEEQQKSGVKGKMSFYTFSTKVETVYTDVDINKVKPLESFNPRGMTVLHDAIAQAVNDKLASENKTDVTLVITTDGRDTASQHATQKDTSDTIKKVETEYNWKVLYLGANQNSFSEGAKMNMNVKRCANYDASLPGALLELTRAASNCVSMYRTATAANPEVKHDLFINKAVTEPVTKNEHLRVPDRMPDALPDDLPESILEPLPMLSLQRANAGLYVSDK